VSVPSDSSAAESSRRRPGCVIATRQAPSSSSLTRTRDPGNAASTDACSASASPMSSIVISAAARSSPDADSPVRRPGVATYTPVLASSGDDLAAALMTIELAGDADALQASVDVAFPGSRVVVTGDDDGVCRVAMTQPGLRRPLSAAELSDGTLTFLLLVAAALATRPPDLLVLNEPESSLHPSLMPAVAALIASAAERSQVLVVTHAGDLVRALRSADATTIELTKGGGGATSVEGAGLLDGPAWTWPKR